MVGEILDYILKKIRSLMMYNVYINIYRMANEVIDWSSLSFLMGWTII